jgi:hypothetical protein
MKLISYRRALWVLGVSCILRVSQATELVDERGNLTGAVALQSLVSTPLTVGGYPVPLSGADWRFTNFVSRTATGARTIPMVYLGFSRLKAGQFVEGFSVTTTLSFVGDSSAWHGDQCSGTKLISINIVRSRLDRCAVAEIKQISISNIPTDTLVITFLETNTNARYLRYQVVAPLSEGGLSRATVGAARFKSDLEGWMRLMLSATVEAAKPSKAPAAFSSVPSFSDAILGKYAVATAQEKPKSNTTGIESSRSSVSAGIEDRLAKLKSLHEKGLITDEEYKNQRKAILDAI